MLCIFCEVVCFYLDSHLIPYHESKNNRSWTTEHMSHLYACISLLKIFPAKYPRRWSSPFGVTCDSSRTTAFGSYGRVSWQGCGLNPKRKEVWEYEPTTNQTTESMPFVWLGDLHICSPTSFFRPPFSQASWDWVESWLAHIPHNAHKTTEEFPYHYKTFLRHLV